MSLFFLNYFFFVIWSSNVFFLKRSLSFLINFGCKRALGVDLFLKFQCFVVAFLGILAWDSLTQRLAEAKPVGDSLAMWTGN